MHYTDMFKNAMIQKMAGPRGIPINGPVTVGKEG